MGGSSPKGRRRGIAPAVKDSARIAGWMVGLEAGLAGIGGLLVQHRAGSVAFQAFAAEWAAGRLGVSWNDPTAPAPTVAAVLRRVGQGAIFGLVAASLTLGLSVVTGAVRVVPSSSPSLTGMALGLFLAAFVAVKDELVLRGVVLRAFRHTLSPAWQLAVCGVIAAAVRLGQATHDAEVAPLTTAVAVVAAGLIGVSYATLWLRERGAWLAWAAHTTWTLVTTTVVSGGVMDAFWAPSRWGGGALGFDGSLAALVAVALVTMIAIVAVRTPTRTG